MHLLGISVFCLALIYANLALESSQDYYDYDYDQDQGDAMVSTGKLISTSYSMLRNWFSASFIGNDLLPFI